MKADIGKLEKISFKTLKSGRSANEFFRGTWLIHPNEELTASPDDSGVSWDLGNVYALAQTAKGRLAVLVYSKDDTVVLEDYDSLEELKSAQIDNQYPAYPDNVLDAFGSTIDPDYEIELDI